MFIADVVRLSHLCRYGASQWGASLVLHAADRLDLIGVSLGAKLVVVFELALTSVSLEDVLVSTITRELVAHPPVEEERRKKDKYSFRGWLSRALLPNA